MLYLWSLCDYMPSGTKLPFFLQLYEWFFLAKFLGHFELSQSLTFPRTSLTAFGITKSWVYFPFRTRNDEWKYALGAMHLKLNEMRLFFMFVCMFFFLFFVFLVCFFNFFWFLTVFCDDWASCSNGFLYSYKECTLVCQFDNVFFFVLICSIIFKSVYQTSEPSKDCGTLFEGKDCNKGWDCIFVSQNLPIVWK